MFFKSIENKVKGQSLSKTNCHQKKDLDPWILVILLEVSQFKGREQTFCRNGEPKMRGSDPSSDNRDTEEGVVALVMSIYQFNVIITKLKI